MVLFVSSISSIFRHWPHLLRWTMNQKPLPKMSEWGNQMAWALPWEW